MIKLQIKSLLSELKRVHEREDVSDVHIIHLGGSALGLGTLGVEFCTAYRAGIVLLEPVGNASAIESVTAR